MELHLRSAEPGSARLLALLLFATLAAASTACTPTSPPLEVGAPTVGSLWTILPSGQLRLLCLPSDAPDGLFTQLDRDPTGKPGIGRIAAPSQSTVAAAHSCIERFQPQVSEAQLLVLMEYLFLGTSDHPICAGLMNLTDASRASAWSHWEAERHPVRYAWPLQSPAGPCTPIITRIQKDLSTRP